MPTTFADMLDRWKRFDIIDEATETMRETSRQLLDKQRGQLMAGRANDDGLLPRYEEDTEFFKGNAKAIRAYEKWKAKITPDTPFGVMNFFQNGYTHNRLKVTIQSGKVRINSDVSWDADIERKTNGRAYGLNSRSAEQYRMESFNPAFVKRIKERTGAQ